MKRILFSACSNNGRLVHLATSDGQPACSSKGLARCRVYARITCPACIKKHPEKSKRRAARPHVIGVDWSPLYAAIRRSIDSGDTESPPVRVHYWPILKQES